MTVPVEWGDTYNTFCLWTVYKGPAEFPDGYVIRMWTVEGGEPTPGIAYGFDTLEHARNSLPPGVNRLERAPEDDPVIVETWV